MRQVKKWRYYCDYCNKNGGHPGYMRTHEEHCTNNPNRKCRICGRAGEQTQGLIVFADELQKRWEKEEPNALDRWSDEKNLTEKFLRLLREEAEGCPACMLTAFRLSSLDGLRFIYKVEHKSYWSDRNDERDYCGY